MAAHDSTTDIARAGRRLLLALLTVMTFGGCSTTQTPVNAPTAHSSTLALLDREACEALVHGYALHRDRLNADAYAKLFTQDAVLQFAITGCRHKLIARLACGQRSWTLCRRLWRKRANFAPLAPITTRGC